MNDLSSGKPQPSKEAIEKFKEAELRVRNFTAAGILWSRHLSQAEQQSLGGDINLAYSNGGTLGMLMRVRGCTWQRAVLEIAHKIGFLGNGDYEWLMREYGESLTGDEAFEKAIAESTLVLNEHTREVFWKGESVHVDWTHETLWTFIWEIARHAKKGLPIDSMTFGENASIDIVAKRKSRLVNKEGFPSELYLLIKPIGRGTQKLKLPQEQIRIFERQLSGEILEWFPRHSQSSF